ncbi:MAG: SpoIIE family protein phosphatase [Desulfobacterales bacterium]|nr:SpoIIE family protein phosphatase [Desulfobacterales bacterium]
MTTAEKPAWRPLLLVAVCAWAAVHLIHLVFPEGLDTWNERLVDRFFPLKTAGSSWQTPYDDAIVHVDLNNTSLLALKDFHPSRAHYARVIANLGKIKVAVQMCDIIFAGETNETNDRLLMEAAGAAREVVFGMAFRLVADPQPRDGSAQDPLTLAYLRQSMWKLPAAGAVDEFYTGTDPLITLVPLAELSLGLGFLTLIPDADGVIRRLPLIARLEEGFYPSFALKAVCDYFKVPPGRVEIGPGSITLKGALRPGASQARDIRIPVDARGCMRIHFVGPWGRMKHYHFSDVYAAADDPGRLEQWQEELSGKIALVSDVSTGSADMGQVPIDESYPLSGVHANAVHTILSETFLREMPALASRGVEAGVIIALLLLSLHRSAVVFAAGTAGMAVVLVSAAGLLFAAANRIVPVAQPLLVLLMGWAGMSVWQAVENARRRAEIQKARQIAEHELEIGRKIQAGFLPAELPAPRGWQIAAHFQPARQVSGDFYDVFAMAQGRCTGIVMADVCDHGVGSALFMALTRSLLRAYALQHQPGLDPADFLAWSERVAVDAVRQTNEYIAGTHGEAGMFATLFFGILDPATGRLRFVNGGHEPPLVLRGGQVLHRLKATGLAVGAMAGARFRAADVVLEPGDCLLLYTDGVTDAADAAGNHFSKARLTALAAELPLTARETVARVVAELDRHVGRSSPSDDVTLLVVRRDPPAA